jgi:hypothetical protein
MRLLGVTDRRSPTFARAAVGIVALLTLAGCSILGSATPTPAGSAAATSALSTLAPTPSLAVPVTPAPTLAPTSAPTATPVAAIPLCSPSHLAARITAWDSGAGNRTAHVEVTNTAATTCHIRKLDRPQLVDGHGSVIINGAAPVASSFITITPGGVLKTLVNDSNYCGPAPVAPVTVAFIYPGGVGRFVATALSPTDLSGVPPCFGEPDSAVITMLPWAP